MRQVELQDIVSGCIGVYVEDRCVKNDATTAQPGRPLLKKYVVGQNMPKPMYRRRGL